MFPDLLFVASREFVVFLLSSLQLTFGPIEGLERGGVLDAQLAHGDAQAVSFFDESSQLVRRTGVDGGILSFGLEPLKLLFGQVERFVHLVEGVLGDDSPLSDVRQLFFERNVLGVGDLERLFREVGSWALGLQFEKIDLLLKLPAAFSFMC